MIKFNKLSPIFGVKLWPSDLFFVYKTWRTAVEKGTNTTWIYTMIPVCTAVLGGKAWYSQKQGVWRGAAQEIAWATSPECQIKLSC